MPSLLNVDYWQISTIWVQFASHFLMFSKQNYKRGRNKVCEIPDLINCHRILDKDLRKDRSPDIEHVIKIVVYMELYFQFEQTSQDTFHRRKGNSYLLPKWICNLPLSTTISFPWEKRDGLFNFLNGLKNSCLKIRWILML